jgi:hypothetical protein
LTGLTPWTLAGTYLESCNCDAICPCRTIGGRRGGRSTHGVCLGALSWRIADGRAGEVALSGLNVVLASRYDDDEPGSPWDIHLYVDERGDQRQRDALAQIYLGQVGGTPLRQFPWAFKDSRLLGVHAVPIEIEHVPGHGWFRAGPKVSVRIRGPVADPRPVTCVIPGHHQPGREVDAETLRVDDPPLDFELTGSCGYESGFAYSSEDGA